jgi:predicted choloylglycine hydrolase
MQHSVNTSSQCVNLKLIAALISNTQTQLDGMKDEGGGGGVTLVSHGREWGILFPCYMTSRYCGVREGRGGIRPTVMNIYESLSKQ